MYKVETLDKSTEFETLSAALRFFSKQREAQLNEYNSDDEFVVTIRESVDAPNLDHNLLR